MDLLHSHTSNGGVVGPHTQEYAKGRITYHGFWPPHPRFNWVFEFGHAAALYNRAP